jgi:hypothetical protein
MKLFLFSGFFVSIAGIGIGIRLAFFLGEVKRGMVDPP